MGIRLQHPLRSHLCRWIYHWDAENRLIKLETLASAITAGAPDLTLEYTYDWRSRKIRETVTEASTLTHDQRTLYDHWNPVVEFSSPNPQSQISHIHSYLWGPDLSGTLQGAGGVGGLLLITDKLLTDNYHPSFDTNGNIIAWSDETGKIIRRLDYDPFGNTIVKETLHGDESALDAILRHGFSTKPADPHSGLLYYGYRWLDPVNGRWSSRDPIEEHGGINLYGFVGNDGVNKADSLGEREVVVEYNAFIPKSIGFPVRGVPVSVHNLHWFKEPGPPVGFSRIGLAATDDRDGFGGNSAGSSRIHTKYVFESCDVGFLDTSKNPKAIVGASHKLQSNYSGYVPGSLQMKIATPKWTNGPAVSNASGSKNLSIVRWGVEATYPFSIIAPSIDLDIVLELTMKNSKSDVNVSARGNHNGFPAYELIVDGKLIHHYRPTASGPGYFNLWLQNIAWRASTIVTH